MEIKNSEALERGESIEMNKPGEKEVIGTVISLILIVSIFMIIESIFSNTNRITKIHEGHRWIIVFLYVSFLLPVFRLVSKYTPEVVYQRIVIILYAFPVMMIMIYIIRSMFVPALLSSAVLVPSFLIAYKKGYEKFRNQ